MRERDKLGGRSILVVEDEYLTASSLAGDLEEAGAEILGPASDVESALSIIEGEASGLDAAVLDINLRGKMVFDVADRLVELAIPFLFVTGYQCDQLPERFQATPCLNKPCDELELIGILAALPMRENLG